MPGSTTTADLKEMITGRRDAVFVWLCNFEAEAEWGAGYTGLPATRLSVTSRIVQRMEELGALLADPEDYLLLSQPLDRDYRQYVEGIGFTLPQELSADRDDGASTSDAVLATPRLLARLADLAARGAYLMPMGCTAKEQKISEVTGLRLATPGPDVTEKVNSKIYSRRLTGELGLRTIPGFCCETTQQLHAALQALMARYGQAIVKDAYGVSGKGLVMLDSEKKADRLLRMVDQRATRTGSHALDVVAERLVDKRFDMNYQFTIGRDGQVRFDFIKQALVRRGIHSGHIMPAELTIAQHDEIVTAAERIGQRLYADGFSGVVGVDSLLGTDGLIYPVVEINARLNMSTFQSRVAGRFQGPEGFALAKHYPLQLTAPLEFRAIRDALAPHISQPARDDGAVITCFGTVNALAAQSAGSQGRLYTMLFAASRDELSRLDEAMTQKIATLDGGDHAGH